MLNWFSEKIKEGAVGVAKVALDGRFLQVNQALCVFLQTDEATLLKTRFQDITHPEDLLRDEALLERLHARGIGGRSMLKRYLMPDGSCKWAELKVALVRDRKGKAAYYLSQVRETRTMAETLQRLHDQANRDPVANVLNRHALQEQLLAATRRAARSGQAFSVTLLDLDGFKQVNDTRGHAIGDALLVQVGQRLKLASGARDLVGRMGGDEFLVLAPELRDRSELEHKMARIRRCFSTPFMLPDGPLNQSASVGTAVFPDDGATVTELMQVADSRMYLGKNRALAEQAC